MSRKVSRLHFRRMPLEDWFDRYQYEIDYDLGESGVKYHSFSDLRLDLADVQLRYGHHSGSPELRRAIAEQYDDLTPDQIIVTTGSSESNFAVIASLVGSSDHMVIEHPNYPSLYEVPLSLGLSHDLFQLAYEQRFRPDVGRLGDLIKSNTKLVSLTHPNNPTGSVISEKALREVVELVESHRAYLVHDETYRELSFDKPPPPAAVLSDRAISMTTMSKAYGLPGIRIGWVAGPKSIIESIRAVREQLTICNNALGEAIALRALERKDEFLNEARQRVLSNLRVLKDWMAHQDSLEWVEPEGGVVAFPRLKSDVDTEDLSRTLVTRHRTFTIPGYCFGMNRHLRIGYGGETSELKEGLSRLKLTMDESVPSLRASP